MELFGRSTEWKSHGKRRKRCVLRGFLSWRLHLFCHYKAEVATRPKWKQFGPSPAMSERWPIVPYDELLLTTTAPRAQEWPPWPWPTTAPPEDPQVVEAAEERQAKQEEQPLREVAEGRTNWDPDWG